MYQDAVNDDEFWGAIEGTAKFKGIEVERKTRMATSLRGNVGLQIVYLRVTYTIHFRGEGWDLVLLDAGPRYRPSNLNPNKLVSFQDGQGHPYIDLLDGKGHNLLPLANAPPPMDPTAAPPPPVFLPPLRQYKRLPFSALNLPQTFL